MLKLSLGWRLFIAVLLSMICIVAIALYLMRDKVSNSFADYALKIELDRLQEVSDEIKSQYAQNRDWSFLPEDTRQKQIWITQELLRLYQIKNDVLDPSKSKLGNQVNIVVATPAQANIPTDPNTASNVNHGSANFAIPAPPLPPLPPLPPPPPNTNGGASQASEQGELSNLINRISLVDHNRQYLAGRPLDQSQGGSRPIYLGKETIAYLFVQQSRLPSDTMSKDFLQEQADIIVVIILISIVLSGVAALLLALHFRSPIHRLVDGARSLSEGQYDTRLDEQRSDELGELAHSFNQLAEKLEQIEQSRRQWVADTSHELRTPISVLRAQLEALQDGIRSATPDNIALMLRQVLSLNKLIDELYVLAKSDIGTLHYQMQTIDCWKLVSEEADNFAEKIQAAELQLDLCDAPNSSMINGDIERLRQVFHNLLENAVRYTNSGGRIKISASNTAHQLIIHIEDTAPSVPPSSIARLGERFYRVDNSRNRAHGGSGLGLALCRRILESHQARLVFSDSDLGGLCVTMYFPLANIKP